MTRSQGYVRDLEELTSLAYHMLSAVDVAQMEQERLHYAAGLFKIIYLTGDAIVRLHPESDYYGEMRKPEWNPPAIAVLNRVLIEAYVDFHHLFIDCAPDDEREFRLLVAQLHRVRDRLELARMSGPGSMPARQSEGEDQLATHVQGLRADLPKQAARLQEKLKANSFLLNKLSDKQRSRFLTGDHTPGDRYKGTNCQPGREQRAKRAGLRPYVSKELRSHLSAYIHAGPHAVDQIVFFHPHVGLGRQFQITCRCVSRAGSWAWRRAISRRSSRRPRCI